VEIKRVLALGSPNNVVGGLPLQKIRELRRLLAIVEELVKRHFQSPSELLQRFDSGNRVAIFNAGYVAPKQSCCMSNNTFRHLSALSEQSGTSWAFQNFLADCRT